MWGLREEEQARLMEAVEAVVKPWWQPVDSTYIWEREDGTRELRLVQIPGCSPDAPEEVQALNAVYEGIIGVGALAVSPRDWK